MTRFGQTETGKMDLTQIHDWADLGRRVREAAARAARESIEMGPNVRGSHTSLRQEEPKPAVRKDGSA
ncbi:MAG: hypothetical protein HOP29_09280 [Phycisphaerales bacterium]|nr:hypothetical protein [Phycisphaerales bacterium]